MKTNNFQTPDLLEGRVVGTQTGMVTTKTGGSRDILAVTTENIRTTHQNNTIADIESPSTSTDSRMIGGSTGGLVRADTIRKTTDTTQITVSTDTENKNREVENNTIPGIMKVIRGIIKF